MSKNREIEAKVTLTQAIYEKLLKSFPTKDDFVQTNTYYDTEDWLLKSKRNSLRIRTFTNSAEETIKVPESVNVQNKYHEALEINDKLTREDADNYLSHNTIYLDGNVGKFLKNNYSDRIPDIKIFSWSRTHRSLLNGPENTELTLDHTEYPDGFSDYELEVENDDPEQIKRVLNQLCNDFSFSTDNPNNISKVARATMHSGK